MMCEMWCVTHLSLLSSNSMLQRGKRVKFWQKKRRRSQTKAWWDVEVARAVFQAKNLLQGFREQLRADRQRCEWIIASPSTRPRLGLSCPSLVMWLTAASRLCSSRVSLRRLTWSDANLAWIIHLGNVVKGQTEITTDTVRCKLQRREYSELYR